VSSFHPCFAAAIVVAALGAAASPVAAAPPRTLDEITIEGELHLPQVLFITSRESTRPLDWLDYYAAPPAAEVARTTPLPTRIEVIPSLDSADNAEDPELLDAPSLAPDPSTAPSDPAESTKERQR
jgi:hypothetical protein